MISNNDIALVIKTLEAAGYTAFTQADGSAMQRLDLHYRHNPDGTVRWLWPAGTRRAGCLRFYYAGTRRARLASAVIDWLFKWGGERLFSHGGLTLYLPCESYRLLRQRWGGDFAIFTGTPGINRKSLVWVDHDGAGQFMKLSLDGTADNIVAREQAVLDELCKRRFFFLRLPQVISKARCSVVLEDISIDGGRRPAVYADCHDKALTELQLVTGRKMTVGETSWWPDVWLKLSSLKCNEDPRLPKGIVTKLEYLARSISARGEVRCYRAHGDLTPWNTVPQGARLGVFDWELSIPDAPVVWDAFHFVLQSGVLLHRLSPAEIFRQMKELRTWSVAVDIARADHSLFSLHLRLYLLTNITYYLHLYSRQVDWHRQVYWLLETWTSILNMVLLEDEVLNQRQLLTIDLFDALRDQPYAVLKWMERSPESLSELSDIDMCVAPAVVGFLDTWLRSHHCVAAVHGYRQSFLQQYHIVLKDGGLLSIDAIWQFRRKDLVFLDAGRVLERARVSSYGVKVPAEKWDLSYVWLFYLLNGASVPSHYREWFAHMPVHVRAAVDYHFESSWQTGLRSFSEAFGYSDALRAAVLCQLEEEGVNKGMGRLRRRFSYMADTLRNFFRLNGMLITFSGVDGAGKSTVIETVRQRLEKQFRRRVVVLRHRPSLLPILSSYRYGREKAEQLAVGRLPRQGGNLGRLSSLVRFFYYYLDYLFGQLYIQVRYVWRGYIVLYDRYYFDFISDSRRSNIRLPEGFTRWWYRFLIKPRLNFFLYASPEDILLRKQELDAATIRHLTGSYLSLFQRLSKRYRRSSYIPILNVRINTTLDAIVQHIKTYSR